ncbi:MAG: hypothetical protein JW909_13895, partial [Planctomycetes bacterium]|nr:hypothetical protein [Planctomycetota bacterium]
MPRTAAKQKRKIARDNSAGIMMEVAMAEAVSLVWSHKLLVAACVASAVLVTAAFHYGADRKYCAETLIMPSQTDENGSMAAKLAAIGADLPAGVLSSKCSTERYVDILKSRRVADAVIDRFDLMRRYGIDVRGFARQRLAAAASFEITRGGLISVAVTDKDPALAADIANGYVCLLEQIDHEINVGKAGRERRFLDERLRQVEADLADAQAAWRSFQEKHRIVLVDEGLRSTATVMAELEARRQAKEIELEVLESVYAADSPNLKMLKTELAKLNDRLRLLSEKGVQVSSGHDTEAAWLFPAVEKVPALALEQLELQRKCELQSRLYELLATQRELARTAEAREVSTIQVVSPALPPDVPRRIRLKIKAGIAAVLSFIFAVFLVQAVEAHREHLAHSAAKTSPPPPPHPPPPNPPPQPPPPPPP